MENISIHTAQPVFRFSYNGRKHKNVTDAFSKRPQSPLKRAIFLVTPDTSNFGKWDALLAEAAKRQWEVLEWVLNPNAKLDAEFSEVLDGIDEHIESGKSAVVLIAARPCCNGYVAWPQSPAAKDAWGDWAQALADRSLVQVVFKADDCGFDSPKLTLGEPATAILDRIEVALGLKKMT